MYESLAHQGELHQRSARHPGLPIAADAPGVTVPHHEDYETHRGQHWQEGRWLGKAITQLPADGCARSRCSGRADTRFQDSTAS